MGDIETELFKLVGEAYDGVGASAELCGDAVYVILMTDCRRGARGRTRARAARW